MPYLQRLALTDFRSYRSLTWRPESRIATIVGPNGSGKTNLLEAISLLVPGRGLRGARNADLSRIGGDGGWAVAGRFEADAASFDIGTGTTAGQPGDRRQFRLDGAAPRSQAEIATRLAAVWITPQMDRLFQEGLGGRRRFLDRLVWALEPGHAREIAAHDTAMGNRNRLLAAGRADAAWLTALEDAMARHAVAATAARTALVVRLDAALSAGVAGSFPRARVALACPIADSLGDGSALATEDWLRATLAANRQRDAAAGGASVGAHRTDLLLSDARTGTPAALASTGEQKALLIATILAHAAAIADARGFAPILLLDEPAVHLDAARRTSLFEALVAIGAQTVMTGTDADSFAPLRGTAEFLAAGDGMLRREAP